DDDRRSRPADPRHLLAGRRRLFLCRTRQPLRRRLQPRRTRDGADRDARAGARRELGGYGSLRAGDVLLSRKTRGALAAFAGIAPEALWLRPIGLLRGAAAQAMVADGTALPLA